MSGTHSPGPWRVGEKALYDNRVCVYDRNGGRVASAPDHNGNALADAELIAAAPEMLALLQDLEWYLEGHVCPRCGGTRPNHLDLCRLAALLERLK